MTLSKKGKYWYGSSADDVRLEIARYSQGNRYEAALFERSICDCGGDVFELESDEDEGAAARTCTRCRSRHLIGDSADYAADAQLERHECVCGAAAFELTSGVALYADSRDVRWFYIGCRCASCRLVGVFADWRCEGGDADALLARV